MRARTKLSEPARQGSRAAGTPSDSFAAQTDVNGGFKLTRSAFANSRALRFERAHVTVQPFCKFHRSMPNGCEPCHAFWISSQFFGSSHKNVAVPNNRGQLVEDMVGERALRHGALPRLGHIPLLSLPTERSIRTSVLLAKCMSCTTSSSRNSLRIRASASGRPGKRGKSR
jgi:hypothetical protein